MLTKQPELSRIVRRSVGDHENRVDVAEAGAVPPCLTPVEDEVDDRVVCQRTPKRTSELGLDLLRLPRFCSELPGRALGIDGRGPSMCSGYVLDTPCSKPAGRATRRQTRVGAAQVPGEKP
jgi:hypothetical protein